MFVVIEYRFRKKCNTKYSELRKLHCYDKYYGMYVRYHQGTMYLGDDDLFSPIVTPDNMKEVLVEFVKFLEINGCYEYKDPITLVRLKIELRNAEDKTKSPFVVDPRKRVYYILGTKIKSENFRNRLFPYKMSELKTILTKELYPDADTEDDSD